MTSGSQQRETQLHAILVKCRAYIHSSSSPQLLSTSLALFRACMLGGRATELLDAAADMRGKGSAAPRMGEPNTMLPSTATWAVSSSLAGLCWLLPKMLPPCTSRRLTAAPGPSGGLVPAPEPSAAACAPIVIRAAAAAANALVASVIAGAGSLGGARFERRMLLTTDVATEDIERPVFDVADTELMDSMPPA